jgi:ABC-type lipoprotein export system ATPase subunit
MLLTMHHVVPQYLQHSLNGRVSAIWGTEVRIQQGELLSVLAPSGAGKSTFVQLLYGLRNDYAGTAKWDDLAANTTDTEALAALRTNNVSIVFQDLRLFGELTAMENIEIKRCQTNTVSIATALDYLHRLGMSHKSEAVAATLSYGERQRIAIIRALMQPFDWLLMDEPFSHLDTDNRQKAITLIQETVQARKAGMILADLNANNYFAYTQTLIM